MSDRRTFELTVDGRARRVEAEAGATLLTVLRDGLGVTSPKRGCNQGVCGSCTIAVDGWPVRSCLSLAANCEGKAIATVEGAANDRILGALQRSFAAHGAVQCGFCTAGMLIAARHLLAETPRPGVDAVRDALSGNLCRCTGYRKIIDAVIAAGEELSP